MKKRQSIFAKQTKKFKKAQRHAQHIAMRMLNRRRFNRFLRILGPGLVTGAADDDPSGIATYSQAGAGYGTGFLWAFPVMYPMLLAIQESCSRIGAVTGRGLAALLKEHYSKKLLYVAVFLVVVANTVNIGADLGAMAATTQLFIPKAPFALLAVLYALVILALVVFVSYKKYAKVLKWLAIALLAYPVTAIMVTQDWPEVFRATFMTLPKLDASMIYIFVGILGTTISPYLFFWDTSEVVEDEIAKKRIVGALKIPKINEHFLRSIRLDNFVGMTLATVTAWFIVIACSSVLFKHGVTNITSASDAAAALQPLVQGFPHSGFVAKAIFSIGILGLGMLAVPVLAGSAAYAISETVGWREGLWRKFHRATGFYGVIIAATLVGLAINFFGIDPIQALIFTAVFNGVAAVPLIWMVLRVGNNRDIMGEYKNGVVSNVFVTLGLILMTLAVGVLLFFMATGQLH